MRLVILSVFLLALICFDFEPSRTSAPGQESTTLVSAAEQKQMTDKAVAFLRTSQSTDGSFSSQAGPGITGLSLRASRRRSSLG